MDLWPLVPVWGNSLSTRLTWYFARIITKVHYKKLGRKANRFVRLVNFLDLFLTDRMTLWLARLNERKYMNRNTDAYVNLYSIYSRAKEIIPRRWLDTQAVGEFEGISVPLVGCTEEYLTHLYGDYMAVPPPWKRASRHVDRF
jgi:phosphorylcholine metabolism protein LicD